jgi:signal transduction histidine kinase
MVNRFRLSQLIPSIIVYLIGICALYVTSLYNWPLFHGLVEAFTIAIETGIFMFTWNARRVNDNNYFPFIGIAFLFTSVIDILHFFSYTGMGMFPNYDINLSSQLWIAGRCLKAISLLIAPLMIHRRMFSYIVVAVYAFIVSLLLLSIFYWKTFPDYYINGVGLTASKSYSEYTISLIKLISIIVLYTYRKDFDPNVWQLLALGILISVFSELSFSGFANAYTDFDLYGHLLRVTSCYIFYKAVIEIAMIRPYDVLFRKQKQNECTLWEYTRELSARNEDLDAFAHTVAHDLRNPIATLMITAKVISDPELDRSSLFGFVRSMVEEIQKINNIIDELLLLAEVRKVEKKLAILDMQEIVENALNRLRALIQGTEAQIICPPTWPQALGYAAWIEEVWENYISNALKYGGDPTCIELGADEEKDGFVRFWIRDNGQGINDDQKERLFKPFTQLQQIHLTGNGLGLSIVRRIIEKLGGQVGVESSPGAGSLFYFTLPTAPDTFKKVKPSKSTTPSVPAINHS